MGNKAVDASPECQEMLDLFVFPPFLFHSAPDWHKDHNAWWSCFRKSFYAKTLS